MSAPSTTAAVPPAVPAERVAPRTVLALSIAEGRRLLRHPVLLAGAALGALWSIQPWLGGEPHQDWVVQNYLLLTVGWAPLYLAAFIVANSAALRERETTTAEMFRSSPTGYPERTLALLAAGLVPVALAAALAAVQRQVIMDAGGVTVGDQLVELTPTVVEMGLVPATTAVAFACGLALARTVRSQVFGVVFGAVATFFLSVMFWIWPWFPAYFLTPYMTSLHALDLGEDFTLDQLTTIQQLSAPQPDLQRPESHWWVLVRDADIVGWHAVYLIGLALLFAAYAVRRSGRDHRVRRLLISGAFLVVGGLALSMTAFGGPFDWWRPLPFEI